MTETAPLLEAWYPLLAKESAEFKVCFYLNILKMGFEL